MPHYKRYREFQAKRVNLWWPGTESNRRHKPFQGSALPTELPGLKPSKSDLTLSINHSFLNQYIKHRILSQDISAFCVFYESLKNGLKMDSVDSI